MPEVEIYHEKIGHSGMKNKEVMKVLAILGEAWGKEGNRVKWGKSCGGN